MADAHPPIPPGLRDEWLRMSDEDLLSECSVDTYRASGPGGQKRNKTSSAVRIRHAPSGLSVISEESRSQHENKRNALRRLRMAIAIEIRAEIDDTATVPADLQVYILSDGRIRIAEKNDDRPRFIAFVLDCLQANSGSAAAVASKLGSTSSQLIRLIGSDGAAFAATNRMRSKFGLHPLRPQSGK